jgi:hypothetical protein
MAECGRSSSPKCRCSRVVAKATALLSTMMKASVRAGYLPTSPCDGVRLPRTERFLVPSEVMARADAMGRRYRTAVALGAYLRGDEERFEHLTHFRQLIMGLKAARVG